MLRPFAVRGTSPMPTMPIASLADIPENGGRAFAIGDHAIAIFRVGSDLYAIDDTCTHADASLSSGELDTDELCVECPLHGARFDLCNGSATLPAYKPVKTYKVWAEGDAVFVEFVA